MRNVMNRSEAKHIQMRLAVHGFPSGVIDGLIGPITIKAVKAFQSFKGLSVDGDPGPNTLKALNKAPIDLDGGGGAIDRSPDETPEWPRQRDVTAFYGKPGDHSKQTMIALPYPMKLAWDTSITVRRTTVHKKVASHVQDVLAAVKQEYGMDGIREIGVDLFGGALNVRKMRGGSAWSMHSWGIALDFDPARNRLEWNHKKARLARPDAKAWWECWGDAGAISLGKHRDFDWMHVQFARL